MFNLQVKAVDIDVVNTN